MAEEEMKEKILEWLNKQGYPLEMYVGRVFQKAGLKAIQSEYYFDEEIQNNREVDVVGIIGKTIGDRLVRFNFIVECKFSRDKPWILFTSESIKLADPARVAQRAGSISGIAFLQSIASNKNISELEIFELPARVGYGVTQAHTDKNDVAYNACITVSKATRGLFRDQEKGSPSDILDIAIPLIVVDGKLFESFLDDSSNVQVEEVSAGTLVWRNNIVGRPHTFIGLVSREEFPAYLERTLNSVKEFFRILELNQGYLELKKWEENYATMVKRFGGLRGKML